MTWLRRMGFELIPVLIGLFLWSGIRDGIVGLAASRFDLHPALASYLEQPGLYRHGLAAAALYALVLGFTAGWRSVIGLALRLLLFPVYLIGLLVWQAFWIGNRFIFVTRKVLRALARPEGAILWPTAGLMAGYFVLNPTLGPGAAHVLSFFVLPVVSVLYLIWLYWWTYNPFSVLKAIKPYWDKIVDWYVGALKDQLASETTDAEAVQRRADHVVSILRALDRASRFISDARVNRFVVHVFVIQILCVTALLCLFFALAYYGAYSLDPVHFQVEAGHDRMFDFLALSLRHLLFSSYTYLAPASYPAIALSVLENLVGVVLFIILVLTFSMVATYETKAAWKGIAEELDRTASRFRAILPEKKAEEAS